MNNPTSKTYKSKFDKRNRLNEFPTTHYYYRFLPKDSTEYNLLVNDTLLAVSDTPFEYEVQTEGAIYQDPGMAGTDFTWYYSTVPADYNLSAAVGSVQREKLEDLYFTREDEIQEYPTPYEEELLDIYYELNTTALLISDNLGPEVETYNYLIPQVDGSAGAISYSYEELQPMGVQPRNAYIDFAPLYEEQAQQAQQKGFWRSKWRPSGTVKVEEDALPGDPMVGVMGAEIRVRKWGWLVITRGWTDRNGNFSTGRTRTARVKYACYFNTFPYFTVKAGTYFWNARHRGHRTYKKQRWDTQNFMEGTRSHFYALVQNAAYDYYTRIASEYGIKRPSNFIKISAKFSRCVGSQHRPDIVTGFWPISEIRISRKTSSCSYRNSDGVYATTVHELTHRGHRDLDPGMFSIFSASSCNRAFLTESWAEGVETIVTNDRYFGLSPLYQSSNPDDITRWNSFRQRVTAANMNEYTPIVEDLIDNFNQNTVNSTLPVDNVSGFSLQLIEDALDNSRDLVSWRVGLQYPKPRGVTSEQIRELFDYTQEARFNNNPDRCD
ncbi:MAG: hypothetical protein WBG71_06775 [Leeuwenhoekiella sp.]